MFESIFQEWGAVVLALIPLCLTVVVLVAEAMRWVKSGSPACTCSDGSTL
jgi:hypothetical protein